MLVRIAVSAFVLIAASAVIFGQVSGRELNLAPGQTVEIINHFGRIEIVSKPEERSADDVQKSFIGTLSVTHGNDLTEKEIVTSGEKGVLRIEARPENAAKRIDLLLELPERLRLKVKTLSGAISVQGNFETISASTETGTISVDVPTDDLSYDLLWTTSKPRFLADFSVADIKERSGGRFQLKGHIGEKTRKKKKKKNAEVTESAAKATDDEPQTTGETDGPVSSAPKNIALNFTTARGIILLNVPPNEVMSDLRERPLTEAARSIVRSGDSLLVESIRRASPKYFGDFMKTLPPARLLPRLTVATRSEGDLVAAESVKTVTARVLDDRNRAIAGLSLDDFEVTENGEPREIVSVKPVTAPFNLVLLLDVSGSVDNYVNFIRKAARAFVNTVDPDDRVSIVLFNDDVKVLAGFTTDRAKLSASLDSFDAGGGTAYYDAIGYTLVETLRPLKGERTAIVVLTDGDDNRSFLPFDSLAGTIEESGALIYPLYVPSSLAALGAGQDLNAAVDPLRTRYLNVSLTSKANGEGARLAQISGGVYYPITQLSQIQAAYGDIVVQLRTGYDITFRSVLAAPDGKASPRLRIRSKKPGTFTQISGIRQ